MGLLFAGGEDSDFTFIGGCSVDTATTAARRTANARCSLKVLSGSVSDGWFGTLSAASSTFWLTARVYSTSSQPDSASFTFSPGNGYIVFRDGAQNRLYLSVVPSVTPATTGYFRLVKQNAAGTTTVLATSTVLATLDALAKFDISVNYAVAGSCKVYLNGTLIIEYSGDVTTDGATTLSGVGLGQLVQYNFGATGSYWSEVICGTADTRSMSLVTLPPAANGNTFSWTNSFASIDETTLDDADLCASATANQVSEVTVNSAGITSTPGIVGVVVSARAQKGGTGPANANLMVRTAATDYFSSSIALPASLQRISNVWELNPNTGAAWVFSDLTAAGFNVGIRSLT